VQFRQKAKLVEPAGFEPATSSMPSRRAPNCATAPRNANTVIAFIAPCECERQTTPYNGTNCAMHPEGIKARSRAL
jgi:hypothetical protein